MGNPQYVIGLDFGTDSVRALIAAADTGEELATEIAYYKRWGQGLYCDPLVNQFRQHPLDYLESLEACITGALAKLPPGAAKHVAGIGVGATGSTPSPVDRAGRPLALLDEFKANPNGMFNLWKDHTAVQEAAEINDLAKNWGGVDFTKYSGRVYSSEWLWSKCLHISRVDRAVREATYSWVELCDWIPAVLTGTEDSLKMKRSRCAAGHKAMWHEEWGGLPSEEFLVKLDPLLQGLRTRLYEKTYTSDQAAGHLTPAWAGRLGLTAGIPVAVGAIDAHVGAIGGGIREKSMMKIMGTSTCDIIVVSKEDMGETLVEGMCGQVDSSVIPGLIGVEAGQSAFGDIYAWFRELLLWPLAALQIDLGLTDEHLQRAKERILVKLAEEAEKIDPAATTVLALDWLNGRRTPFADQQLKGVLAGLTLGSDAPRIFRALVEATAFGSLAIAEQFKQQGLEIGEVIAQGGIPKRSDFVMQVTADVMNMPIKVVQSDQTGALGAAMCAAAAADLHQDLIETQSKMGSGYSHEYVPNPDRARFYQELYQKYLDMGERLAPLLRSL